MTEARLEVARRPWALAVPRGSNTGKQIVLATVALLVLIRLPTEVLGILPSALKLIDVPLLALLLAVAALSPATPASLRRPGYVVAGVVFFAVAVGSTLANLSRVAVGPDVLFLYGFLGPLASYQATYTLWPAGNARVFSRLLVGLGVLQLLTVATIELPRFLSSGNPDEISGTFGENPYQLVFFLLVFAALVAAVAVVEPRTMTARAAPLLVAASLTVVFLAQYRALLSAAALSMLVLAGLLLRAGRRGATIGLFVVGVFVAALAAVSVFFPTTKYQPYLAEVRQSPLTLVQDRVHALGGVADMYDALPETIPLGSGPGTFSSRAWQTFDNPFNPHRSPHDPVYRLVDRISGGAHYTTDVSQKYSLDPARTRAIVLGSRAVTSPYASYTSLLAEVGILGFAVMVGIYVAATGTALGAARDALRRRDGAPEAALLVAAAMAFVVLLQMAVLGNWLEVTRITFPAWMTLAVALKELRARRAREAP